MFKTIHFLVCSLFLISTFLTTNGEEPPTSDMKVKSENLQLPLAAGAYGTLIDPRWILTVKSILVRDFVVVKGIHHTILKDQVVDHPKLAFRLIPVDPPITQIQAIPRFKKAISSLEGKNLYVIEAVLASIYANNYVGKFTPQNISEDLPLTLQYNATDGSGVFYSPTDGKFEIVGVVSQTNDSATINWLTKEVNNWIDQTMAAFKPKPVE